jgi:alkyl hydroperoxide reductase subunit F
MYDLIIVGAGPAGTGAGVYAARKKLKTLLITESFDSQSAVSPDIQNWIGTVSISGTDLMKSFRAHLEAYANTILTLKEGLRATGIRQIQNGFEVTTNKGAFEARSVLIASGARRRKLTVPGAEKFDQKGLTYCASCDGPLFAGRDVAVVGGGNAGFETASQLLAYAKSVTLLEYHNMFKADPVTVERVLAHTKMKVVRNTEILEVKGTMFVESLRYKERTTGEEHELPVEGVFVEIGLIPSTDYLKGFVELNKYNMVVVDPRTQATSVKGVWAAGDCTDGLYHQNNISAGDAVKALEDIYNHLNIR